eukprot:Lankesteria_metandrocarpae@DN751_c0_g1_i2.p1
MPLPAGFPSPGLPPVAFINSPGLPPKGFPLPPPGMPASPMTRPMLPPGVILPPGTPGMPPVFPPQMISTTGAASPMVLPALVPPVIPPVLGNNTVLPPQVSPWNLPVVPTSVQSPAEVPASTTTTTTIGSVPNSTPSDAFEESQESRAGRDDTTTVDTTHQPPQQGLVANSPVEQSFSNVTINPILSATGNRVQSGEVVEENSSKASGVAANSSYVGDDVTSTYATATAGQSSATEGEDSSQRSVLSSRNGDSPSILGTTDLTLSAVVPATEQLKQTTTTIDAVTIIPAVSVDDPTATSTLVLTDRTTSVETLTDMPTQLHMNQVAASMPHVLGVAQTSESTSAAVAASMPHVLGVAQKSDITSAAVAASMPHVLGVAQTSESTSAAVAA